MVQILQRSAQLTRRESRRASLGSVRSGVKAWLGFARHILGYREWCIPPVASRHVQFFGEIFRFKATACNYIGYIKWVCKESGVDLSWHDAQKQVWIKGAKANSSRLGRGVR